MAEKPNICAICGQPKDDKGRCFNCFRSYGWIVSTYKGAPGTQKIYGPPPKKPEDASTCDVCDRFTQFFCFDHGYLEGVADDFVIPQACSLRCLAMAVFNAKKGAA